ncbi:MAG: alpha/beta hydrolase [Patescibacteria group bacterium]
MNKRVFIIHGWGGHPGEHWMPWLKRELENNGFKVCVPQMPDTYKPEIRSWVSKLAEVADNPDGDTYFVGHSIGCNAIWRYLETLSENIKIGGVALVAPWMKLDRKTIEEEGEESIRIVRSWQEKPIDFKKVKRHSKKFFAVFSDDDPYVPLNQAELLSGELDADIAIEKGKGHFTVDDGVTELPVVLSELLNWSGAKT